MCNPISWFYVRHGGATRLIISEKSDSHTEIAEEFGIRDTVGDVAAGEFSTDVANPSPDLKTWRLVWDYQGMSRRPGWMDDEAESHLRAELEKRCAAYVFTTGRHEVDSCRAFAFGDASITVKGYCRVEARGSSSVEARGSSSVVARDSSRVEARGSSSVVARDSSSVVARDSSRVVARDSSRVEARDSSSVVAWDSSSVVAWDSNNVVAWDSSSVVARSPYADIAGRLPWDGKGYKPVRCDIEVGKTYAIAGDKLASVKNAGGEA